MTKPIIESGTDPAALAAAVDAAGRSIPPVWPLASSVAVNPYLGQSGELLSKAGARLGRVAGLPVTMPRSWFAAKIAAGAVSDSDLAAALDASASPLKPASLEALKLAARQDGASLEPLPDIAALAAEVSGIDWTGIISERFGAWAGGYFDEGQSLWVMEPGAPLPRMILFRKSLGSAAFAAVSRRCQKRRSPLWKRSVRGLELAPRPRPQCFTSP
jgi:uncharacterized protein